MATFLIELVQSWKIVCLVLKLGTLIYAQDCYTTTKGQ